MKNGEYLLSSAPLGRAVAKLALPAILTTMISMIYNLTDTYFIGLLRDTAQLSAVSLAMPIMWLFAAVANMIGAGAPQLISMKMGQGDSTGAKKCRSFCVFGTAAMSLLFTPIALLLITPLLRLMNGEGAILAHARDYLTIITLGTVVSATGGAIQNVLRAGGLSMQATICSVVGIVVNIVLDPILILGFDMGMQGAALATVLGSLVSLIVSIFFVRGEISLRKSIPSGRDMGNIFRYSLASTISSVITAVTVGMSFSMAAGFGEATLPSVSVASKIYSMVVSVVSALAFSIQPLIGYNYTSGNSTRMRKGLMTVLITGTAVSLVGMFSFLTMGKPYMAAFTNDPAIIASGVQMLKRQCLGLPVLALQMTCSSYFSATGQVSKTIISTLGRQVIIFVPLMAIMQAVMGEAGLMLAYPITDIIATVLAVILAIPDIRRLFKKQAA